MENNNRNLKVYQSYNKSNEPIPEIRLKGQWLKKIGFNIGVNIEVQRLENMLLIKQVIKEEIEHVKH